MAKKSKAAGKSTSTPGQLLAGKTVCIAGVLDGWNGVEQISYLVELRGGTIVSNVSKELSYLVLGTAKFASKKADAERRNANGSAQIEILDERAFRDLVELSPAEVAELLNAGSDGVSRCAEYLDRLLIKVDLSNNDFRKMAVTNDHPQSDLQRLKMNGADLRGAQLHNIWLGGLAQAMCDGATFSRCRVKGSEDVSGGSFRKLNGFGVGFRDCLLTGADFSESEMECSDFNQSRGERVNFSRAHLKRCDMTHMQSKNSDFNNANLEGASLICADVSDSNFAHATLREAALAECKFSNCDLSDADLRNADLSGADFRGAKMKGARLQGAKLFQTQFDPGVLKTLGISEDSIVALGPKLSELQALAAKATTISLKLRIGKGRTSKEIVMDISPIKTRLDWGGNRYEDELNQRTFYRTTSLPILFHSIAHRFRGETPDLESVHCGSTHSPVSGMPLRKLLIDSLCEAFCIQPLDEKELAALKKSQKAEVDELREKVIAMLKDPKGGLEAFQQLDQRDRKAIKHLKEADFSSVALPAIDLDELDLSKCIMDNANLTNASLADSKLCKASLKKTTLTGALMLNVDLREANLSGADLSNAKLDGATWAGAILTKTNLTGASLSNGQLKGADFSKATLKNTVLKGGVCDETTIWPKDFARWDDLVWRGSGPNPNLQQVKNQRAAAGPIDIATFIKRLETETDPAKLSKALAMLKADRFRFFSEVTSDSVRGVIKSQNDPDLIYSCRLNADGVYSCCTQNLNVCGGLRGSLCKHLLVLIVGLTKAGELDPSLVDQWIAASRLQKPLLDKEQMSEILLKYKGAESGDIDWRPTETIPEDYYAF